MFDRSLVLVLPLVLVVGACSGGSSSTSGSASASPSAAKSGAASSGSTASDKPADKGGGAAAVTKLDKDAVSCSWTKNYGKNDFGDEVPEVECKSLVDKDMKQVQLYLYYYDKDKKQLLGGPSASAENGDAILKAGETKKFMAGKKKGDVPGLEFIQVEAGSGIYGDGSKWEAPKSGWADRAYKE